MKIKAAIVFVFLSAAAFAVFSAKREFTPAGDLPKAAVVYAEFADLPAFLQLWEKSELKEKYLESENFDSLTQRRLGLKLASRWQEFNEAVGFPIDLETVGALAEKRAAIGIYDIGKLEFVFVAPVANEIYAATAFFQRKERFEEKILDDGTGVFSVNVHADRGRQMQQLLFTNVKGRFVLATSESLMLQTLNNINGAAKKNSLSDELSFKNLAQGSKANLVSVWVNQFALNKDYYFKRYWLMSDANKLKNIRAGIFDVSIEDKKIVERRRFLLEKSSNTAKLDPVEMRKLLTFVPENMAFYRLQKTDADASAKAIFDCVFDRKIQAEKTGRRDYFSDYSFYDYDDSAQRNYEYLSRKFDETIDETPGDNFAEAVENKSRNPNLQNVLRSAKPQSVLTLIEPKTLPVPLFAKFRRAAVFKTAVPVNQTQFETAIAQAVRNRVSIPAAGVNLAWKTVEENGFPRRELDLPMLSWKICYTQRGENLIVSNSSNLLNEILAQSESRRAEPLEVARIDNLTVVSLKNKNENFDEIFGKLTEENSNDFFLGSVGSLLETLSEIKTIQIEKSSTSMYQEEKITFNLE